MLISINQLCAFSFHGACLVARLFSQLCREKSLYWAKADCKWKLPKWSCPLAWWSAMSHAFLIPFFKTTFMTGSFLCGQQGFNKDHVLKQLPSSSHLQAMLRRQHSASARSCWSINGLGSYKCDKCVTSSSAKYVEFAGNTDANNACWSCWGSLGWPKPLSIYIYMYIYIHYLYIFVHIHYQQCKYI